MEEDYMDDEFLEALSDYEEQCYHEQLEYEYHRLISLAEVYTGFESFRRRLPRTYAESIRALRKFINDELLMRDLTPQTIEDMKRKVQQSADKDDWQTGGEFKDFKDYPKQDERNTSGGTD